MRPSILLLLTNLAVAVMAQPVDVLRNDVSAACQEFLIPVNVSSQFFVLNSTIDTNWDAHDWTVNLTRRDTATAFNPIVGKVNAEKSYTISAQFCTPKAPNEKSETVMILSHGLTTGRGYWNPSFEGSDSYNHAKYFLDRGYSVFSYDRIGNGKSSIPDPVAEVQFDVQVKILSTLTEKIKQVSSPYTLGVEVRKVILVGHSYGSYLSIAAAVSAPANSTDAIILTGYSGQFDWFNVFLAGWQVRVSALLHPAKWSHLPHGYMSPADIYSDAFLGFKAPYFDHAVAKWLNDGEYPFAIGELLTLGATSYNPSVVTAPVLVFQGRWDISACGGNCDGVLEKTASFFPNSTYLVVDGDHNAGHTLNLHHNATGAFNAMEAFLTKAGL